MIALALFFAFGAAMSLLAALALLFPGSTLQNVWRLNPQAQVGLAALGSGAILLMLVVSVATGRAISRLGPKERGMTVEVTGNQWWWDVRYESGRPDQIITTANEIYIPIGEPIRVKLAATDF